MCVRSDSINARAIHVGIQISKGTVQIFIRRRSVDNKCFFAPLPRRSSVRIDSEEKQKKKEKKKKKEKRDFTVFDEIVKIGKALIGQLLLCYLNSLLLLTLFNSKIVIKYNNIIVKY